MRDWLAYFEAQLAHESRLVREAIPEALAWLSQHAPKVLADEPLSDGALARVAGKLYRSATTRDALTAFHQVLLLLWEHQVRRSPSLRPPEVWRPLPPARPTVAQSHLPVGWVERLTADLLRPLAGEEEAHADIAAGGRWLLLVAWESGVESLAILKAMCRAPCTQWIGLQSPAALTLYLPDEATRIWLGPISAALLSVLRPQPVWATIQRHPEACIAAWLTQAGQRYVAPWERGQLAGMRISELVRDIGLLARSIGLRGMWSSYTPLPDPVMIRAFTGQCLPVKAGKGHGLPITSLPATEEGRSFQQEAALHRQFRACLSEYQRVNPQDQRRQRSYPQARQQLIELTEQPMSRASVLVLRWLAALFSHGSAWKAKLAASTLLTYHSWLKTFIKTAWPDESVFAQPGEAFRACCQQGLAQFEQAEAQYTVLRFLQFCQRHPGMPALELEELTVLTSQGRVRANYLAPAQFDSLCRRFAAGKGRFEQQIVLFMQLCYYAALREDEALSLRCQAISFDTGMLYITPDKRRKTVHAVRKIPLALLPPSVVRALSAQCDAQQSRHATGHAPLFDDWHYPSLEAQFIDFARQALDDSTLVTHSLRHSGANNWVVMLSMLAFDYQPASRPYFLRHALFEPAQLAGVQAMLAALGSPVSLYFPVLEWVSERVGHAGPAITLTVYLHLLDWLALQLTATPCHLFKREVRQWLSDSNYAFELQKRVFVSAPPHEAIAHQLEGEAALPGWPPPGREPTVGEVDPDALLSVAVKRLAGCRRFAVIEEPPVPAPVTAGLSFSQFALEVRHACLGAADSNVSACFLAWLSHHESALPALSVTARQQPAWLRLCQALESTWPTRPRVALAGVTTLRNCCRSKQPITAIRVLNRVLHGYRLLGFQRLTVALSGDEPQGATAQAWCRVIARHGYQVQWLPGENKRVTAAVKPCRFAWPLWREVEAILGLVMAYEEYCQSRSWLSVSQNTERGVPGGPPAYEQGGKR